MGDVLGAFLCVFQGKQGPPGGAGLQGPKGTQVRCLEKKGPGGYEAIELAPPKFLESKETGWV